MKLTTNQIIDLFKALTELRGSPSIIEGPNGKPEVVPIPYPMSEKAKWNAAKNRTILKRLVVAHDEMNQDRMAELNAFKKAQRETWKSEQDPAVKAQKIAEAKERVQDEVDRLNAAAIAVGRESQEVEGLLLIPAAGLCLKTSPIPPTIVSELMLLIDGDPDFEPEAAPKK
jgi:hypothetical protein